ATLTPAPSPAERARGDYGMGSKINALPNRSLSLTLDKRFASPNHKGRYAEVPNESWVPSCYTWPKGYIE
ncbi:MAG TPA: hypothetical protein PL064_13265, partial [Thermogutta sp.]|nr:hypothetical protein [Thermogutta sp.]